MNTYNSPFKDLETLIAPEFINLRVKDFIFDFIDEDGVASGIAKIDNDKGIVYNEDGSYYSFEHNYMSNIAHSVGIAKDKINSLLLNDLDNLHSHRDQLQLELQYLLTHSTLRKFPSFEIPIIDLVDYVNAKYIGNADEAIKVERSETPSITTASTPEEKFDAILGYLQGPNQYGKQILQPEDYLYLKENFLNFNKGRIATSNLAKISVNKYISKLLLLFSFWVLHKHLYGTNKILAEFLELLKKSFTEFDTWELNTIRSKFGSKEGIKIKGVTYLPQLITFELER